MMSPAPGGRLGTSSPVAAPKHFQCSAVLAQFVELPHVDQPKRLVFKVGCQRCRGQLVRVRLFVERDEGDCIGADSNVLGVLNDMPAIAAIQDRGALLAAIRDEAAAILVGFRGE